MALYGYCPGTAVAAIATGRLHAVVDFFGMIAGGIAARINIYQVEQRPNSKRTKQMSGAQTRHTEMNVGELLGRAEGIGPIRFQRRQD